MCLPDFQHNFLFLQDYSDNWQAKPAERVESGKWKVEIIRFRSIFVVVLVSGYIFAMLVGGDLESGTSCTASVNLLGWRLET